MSKKPVYTDEEVDAAVKAGFLSKQDAAYLKQGLDTRGKAIVDPYGKVMQVDRDAALQILASPDIATKDKKKAYESLIAFDKANPPSKKKYGQGHPWGGIAGGTVGGLAGAAIGSSPLVKAALGTGGAIGGAALGSMIAPRRPSPYEDPLGA
jgi:hypothetical protein